MTNKAAFALVLMRTLVGWHFAYEGLYKLVLPGWTRGGQPLHAWTAAGYLQQAGGPLAPWFQWLGQPPALQWVDVLVPVGLVLIGLSLLLGLFTQAGCWSALVMLTLFYLSALPVYGIHQAGTEGAYLLVDKTLVEAAAVLVLIAFRTGEIAGLDVMLARRTKARRARRAVPVEGMGAATRGDLQ
jgi:thiosulfate dehydrogenase [quinone] large subunit